MFVYNYITQLLSNQDMKWLWWIDQTEETVNNWKNAAMHWYVYRMKKLNSFHQFSEINHSIQVSIAISIEFQIVLLCMCFSQEFRIRKMGANHANRWRSLKNLHKDYFRQADWKRGLNLVPLIVCKELEPTLYISRWQLFE